MNEYTVNKQRAIAIGLGIVAVLAIITFAYTNSAKDITLEINGDIREVNSHADTVDELLIEEGIKIKNKGYINYPLDKNLESRMYVVIKDPKSYTIEIGEDKVKEISSPHSKVEEILKHTEINVGLLDYTEPALDAEINDGDTIKFFKVKELVENVEDIIPFEEVTTKNKNLDSGVINILQEGQNGIEKSQIKKKYVNDELVETKTINKKILRKPISQLAEKGTRKLVASRGAIPEQPNRSKDKPQNLNSNNGKVMQATAYDLSYESCGKHPDHPAYGITASGTRAKPGVVAVDPRIIPLGSKLYIESLDGRPDYGYASAEDTGGAIKGNRIDLFFNSKTEVRNFGRRNVRVYILN